MCYHLRVLRKLSTAFHPQIDGQTERQNQELEAYLRIFANWEQSNWASLLDEVAFAYNSKVHAITKCSPIELAYGQLPNVPDGVPDGVQDAQESGEGSKSTNVQLAKTHL